MFKKVKVFNLILSLCMLGSLSGCTKVIEEISDSDVVLPIEEKKIMAKKLVGRLDLTVEEMAPVIDLSEKILSIKKGQSEPREKNLDALNNELNALLNKYTEEKLAPHEPDIENIKNFIRCKKIQKYENVAVKITEYCSYNILDGEKIEKIDTEEEHNMASAKFEKSSLRAWENIKRILPQAALRNFEHLMVFSSEGNADNSFAGAGINALEKDLGVNVSVLDDMKKLAYSLYHEYGHYISLNESQNCKTEGIAEYRDYNEVGFKEISYMHKFYDRFYKYTYDDMQADEEGYLFYLRHKDEFVGKYAATHYFEDFAESFACFIIDDKSENGREKKDFFENFPELVELKEELRELRECNQLEVEKITI